jgi:hypothetical protein
LLNVKVETILKENINTSDSFKIWKNITKNFYDPHGYLIKKEIFDSSVTRPSFLREYRYDENGNYTEFFLDGNLRERREYNEFGKIAYMYYYNYGKITRTNICKYDSLGNENEILTKYSSGRIDTFLITHYNYDYSVNPPLIKSDTTLYNEQNYRQIDISESDSIGRCIRVITLHSDSINNYTTLYYYNDRNLFDSTFQYSNNGFSKSIYEYDKYHRLKSNIYYSNTDSLPYIWNCSYDDKIFMTIDSLYKKNDFDLTKVSDFENTGVVLATLHKGENEILSKNITEYYPIGLIKSSAHYDFKFEKIEKKFYEYEFY